MCGSSGRVLGACLMLPESSVWVTEYDAAQTADPETLMTIVSALPDHPT